MKVKLRTGLFLGLFLGIGLFAQEPQNYYSSATGLSGYALKTELGNIIDNGAQDLGYGGLWQTYLTSDLDRYYEKDGTILDIYSENPAGANPYSYTPGSDQCGNYSVEGDCYNREHIVPQSLFDQKNPMRNDAHFIVPTDGLVNGKRSDYPFGLVKAASFTSLNGSMVGSSNTPGYAGTVFEPIDEFKGDVARMILYFVTRYESRRGEFSNSNDMLANNSDGLATWEKNILLQWHYQDPVSQREIDRNNAIFARQANRNPYIDHPEFVREIWGNPSSDNTPPSQPENLQVSGISDHSVVLAWTAASDDTGVQGYDIFANGKRVATTTALQATVGGLNANTSYQFEVRAFDAVLNFSALSDAVTAQTLAQADTEAPTTPSGVTVSEIGTETAQVSWTASTDNVGVTGYILYLNGSEAGRTSDTHFTFSGLNPGTSYAVQVSAVDAEENESEKSATQNFTTANGDSSGENMEDFESMPAAASSYSTYTWTNPDTHIAWTATDARTDQTIDGRALTLRSGSLTASGISGGIGSLTLTTKLVFSGTPGNLNVYINGDLVGQIPFGATNEVQTTTISDINVSGPFDLEIESPQNSNRVAMDNLNWTAYPTLATSEVQRKPGFSIYPNPVSQGTLFVEGSNLNQVKEASIYSISGQLLKQISAPFQNGNQLNVGELPSGYYLLKLDHFTTKFIVK